MKCAVVFENSFDLGQAYPGLQCKIRPGGNSLCDLLQNLRRGANAKTVGSRQQVIPGDIGKFSVDCHQVLAGPLALGIVGVRYVVGRSKLPFLPFTQDKGDIFDMVVANAGSYSNT